MRCGWCIEHHKKEQLSETSESQLSLYMEPSRGLDVLFPLPPSVGGEDGGEGENLPVSFHPENKIDGQYSNCSIFNRVK